tara:strand:- start:62 stop:580 length:519 start_codon:yes stop_codon:yes gene_type:complete
MTNNIRNLQIEMLDDQYEISNDLSLKKYDNYVSLENGRAGEDLVVSKLTKFGIKCTNVSNMNYPFDIFMHDQNLINSYRISVKSTNQIWEGKKIFNFKSTQPDKIDICCAVFLPEDKIYMITGYNDSVPMRVSTFRLKNAEEESIDRTVKDLFLGKRFFKNLERINKRRRDE